MSSNFDRAFAIVVGLEGGYVEDERDPGGATKYGISKRANPDLDIKNLTLDQAKARYRLNYWPVGADNWVWAEALLCFDTAVNGGNWSRWHSMYAGNSSFVELFQAEHALYLASLPGWQTYGRGWARRLIKISLAASNVANPDSADSGDHPATNPG